MKPARFPAFQSRTCWSRTARTALRLFSPRIRRVWQPANTRLKEKRRIGQEAFIASIHKHEFVAVEQHATEVRQPVFPDVFAEILPLARRRDTIQCEFTGKNDLLV